MFSKWSSEPVDDRGEVNEGQKVQVQFIISCSDPAKPFDPLEEVFDVVALAVVIPAVRPRIASIASRRDAGRPARTIDAAADMIAIKASIGNDSFSCQKDNFLRCNCVGSLPWSQGGLKDLSFGIHRHHELGVESSFCASKSLQMLAASGVGSILVYFDMGRIQEAQFAVSACRDQVQNLCPKTSLRPTAKACVN